MVPVIQYLPGKRKIDYLIDLAQQMVDGDNAIIEITTEE
jgi:hypothetical protein